MAEQDGWCRDLGEKMKTGGVAHFYSWIRWMVFLVAAVKTYSQILGVNGSIMNFMFRATFLPKLWTAARN